MSDSIHTILKQFPGPVRLRSSPRKWLGVLAGSSLFVVLGSVLTQIAVVTYWVSISSIIFFGVGALVSALMLLPGAGSLTLERDGLIIQNLFRTVRCRWADVSPFSVVDIGSTIAGRRMGGAEMIVFDNVNDSGRLADLNRKLMGRSGGLPDTYGFNCKSLATLLNAWRERALAARMPAGHQRPSGPWG